MVTCSKCKKINDNEANFCCRCGDTLSNKKQCPVCLDEKELSVLVCGHSCCVECINRIYEIKKECPECRKGITKCLKCNSFRVLKKNNDTEEHCLNCKNITYLKDYSNKDKSNRIKCVECDSKRILYNYKNNSWNCLDCFCDFIIEDGNAKIAQNLVSTTIICSLCCSNDLLIKTGNMEEENKCLNCLSSNVKTRLVSLEEYSRLKVKNREEVNPQKVKICCDCKGDKIMEIKDSIDSKLYCNTCNKFGIRTEYK